MNIKIISLIVFVLALISIKAQENVALYESENLKIEQLSSNTYRHISYLSSEEYGKVSCNGMIVIDNHEALIFDSPSYDKDSKELIDWIETELKCKVIGVLVTHFHIDCLGGLNEFHKRGIPSYSGFKTIELAIQDSVIVPEKGFDNHLELKVGNKTVLNDFFGEGHTIDNIVSYFPDEEVLFGGCLIKAIGSSKGNLNDANVKEWSKTVQTLKSNYENVKIVVPGHGRPGNSELLDYTIELFKNE